MRHGTKLSRSSRIVRDRYDLDKHRCVEFRAKSYNEAVVSDEVRGRRVNDLCSVGRGVNGRRTMRWRCLDLPSQPELPRATAFTGHIDGAWAAIEAARNLAERAYRLADEARESVTDDVEEWAYDNLDAARETVRGQPLAAIAVALGVGAFFGAVLLRR